jgi:hypothetical protein
MDRLQSGMYKNTSTEVKNTLTDEERVTKSLQLNQVTLERLLLPRFWRTVL